ncbi:carbohydrate binding-domain-containing protein [Cercophora scortea]|uniref:Carbohydrate binding-domain-containing protein n=1 Tax=Cercophora scortea TaxID=314031 RepID=A0AAE0IZ93_9PEZI|nr:carbohydrate binding-domain-containing protein [Cercophora scortea]
MARLPLIAAALLALGNGVLGVLKPCGKAQYDPTQYVCYDNQFLCPIIAGEPLSYCSGACYSKFQYKCVNNVLGVLPGLAAGTSFTLTVSNPTLPINGKFVTAGGLHLSLGGTTSSYCPTQVGSACPPGNITAISAGSYGGGLSMADMVPGGQQVYLDPNWNLAYTQAHSAYIPPGSTVSGFAAYAGGGLVNLNGNGWGWVGCPPTASGGGGGVWNLVARNSSNAASLNNCTPVNLKINTLPGGSYAWQYT